MDDDVDDDAMAGWLAVCRARVRFAATLPMFGALPAALSVCAAALMALDGVPTSIQLPSEVI